MYTAYPGIKLWLPCARRASWLAGAPRGAPVRRGSGCSEPAPQAEAPRRPRHWRREGGDTLRPGVLASTASVTA